MPHSWEILTVLTLIKHAMPAAHEAPPRVERELPGLGYGEGRRGWSTDTDFGLDRRYIFTMNKNGL